MTTTVREPVEEVDVPVGQQFADDFALYWALLSGLATAAGPLTFGRPFDKSRLDGLTLGLRGHFVCNLHRTPGAMRRLGKVAAVYDAWMAGYDAVVSPVLAHQPPRLGHLSPTLDFDELMYRLTQYVVATPHCRSACIWAASVVASAPCSSSATRSRLSSRSPASTRGGASHADRLQPDHLRGDLTGVPARRGAPPGYWSVSGCRPRPS